jgi:hypothetical protein
MPDVGSDQSWATSQLVEFLGVLSGQSDEASAMRAGVERVLESLDAEIGMLVADHTATVVVGLHSDDTRLAGLIEAALAGEPAMTLDDLGECRIATVALSVGAGSQRLVIARLGTEDFEPTECCCCAAWPGSSSWHNGGFRCSRPSTNASGSSSTCPGSSAASRPGCHWPRCSTPSPRARSAGRLGTGGAAPARPGRAGGGIGQRHRPRATPAGLGATPQRGRGRGGVRGRRAGPFGHG